MLRVDELLRLEVFAKLPPSRLEWVCGRVQPVVLSAGETLVKEGDPPRGFFILAEGKLGIWRQSDGVEMPIGRHEAPGFIGEVPILTDEPALVGARALTDCRVYELPAEDFLELIHQCRDVERLIFRAVHHRLRGLESFVRTREKMAALGTLAAGLAHELNNPAAALVRALNNVTPAILELQRMNLVYGQSRADPEHTAHWLQVRDAGYAAILHPEQQEAASKLDDLLLEERLLIWLENYGVEDAWKLAGPLALGRVDPETLAGLTEPWRDHPGELRDMGIRWLALSFDVMEMIQSGLRGSRRIFDLVQAMKSYSHMDRGVQQRVDIHEGLEDTLKLFSFRVGTGVEVRRCYHRDLPQILAYGSELNQVWTHLIDNALDALAGQGIVELTTGRKGDYLYVQIADDGPGIPADIQSRIFEPFYTTKPVGQGSGLGLDVARRIVENRHQGTIGLESQPGRTVFTVRLPLALSCST
ncbi:MAG: cyclic nucleotide-binding domain-containing protein [Aphanocapsa lilacina HA4352-LM1]|nr:cyclic nucleotide-binding domain-containing protein [Aphanocapsa lilacina HA4352-LM1]